MKEIPIIFQPEIIRNILDGVCSLTFRVIKPQPEIKGYFNTGLSEPAYYWKGGKALIKATYGADYVHTNKNSMIDAMLHCCPYGQAGDRLWVRETLREDDKGQWFYKCDGEPVMVALENESAMRAWAHHKEQNYCSSLFMPRWASRITLERTEPAYVKRTLEITEEEARACGFVSDAVIVDTPAGKDYTGHFALDRYWAYWDLLNIARGFPFSDNVWVWGVPFGREIR